ncbi:MAG: S8 family serine peptidase, partial [Acidobacteriota bacterium]
MRPVVRLIVVFSVCAVALLFSFSAENVSGHRLELRSGVLNGPQDAAVLPEALRSAPESLREGDLALARFRQPLSETMREAAHRAGVRFVAPLAADGFIVVLPEGGLAKVAALSGVAWSAPYHPALRIAPEIAAITSDDQRAVVPVSIDLIAGTDLANIARRVLALGLSGRGASPGARRRDEHHAERPARIVLTPTPEQLVVLREQVARWPETLWIGRRPFYGLLNDASAWVGQSGLDRDGATPVYDNEIFGENQVVAVLDTGLDADMCFFRDESGELPPTNIGFGIGTPDPSQRKVLIVNFLWNADDPANPGDWDSQDHGTHVAGSAVGDNLATPGRRDGADGMAPAAKLIVQDGGYGVDDCADLPAIGCPAADLTPFFEQARLQGAHIHSNSWGDRESFTPYNIYSDGSEDADAFMWQNPEFLLVFAAGNNGPSFDTVASPATAKNVLSVGATSHGESSGSIPNFSSRGKTHDGRIKPDVTITGQSVVSANNDLDIGTNNCGTKSSSGTSMACPTAAGLAALVREYFTDGYYPTGAPQPLDVLAPSAALIRAALIASATPMENVAAAPPSEDQGWGRILLDDVLYFPADHKRLFVTDPRDRFVSASDEPDVITLELLDDAEPLRVALVWTDYPSTPAAAINLVNDLDLEAESPSGTIYLGNVFSDGISQPGGSADRLNNVEVLRIGSPEPGLWTIRVRPHAIPQPAQGYGLVATGRMPAPGVVLERTSLELDDSMGGNADGVLEPGEWVDLRLTLFNSGDTLATNVRARVESLTPEVDVIVGETTLPDIASGSSVVTSGPQLRVRLSTAL